MSREQSGGWAPLGESGTVGKGMSLPVSSKARITAARLKLVKSDGGLLNESEIIRNAIQAKLNAIEVGTDQSYPGRSSKEKSSMRSVIISTEMDLAINQAIMTLAKKNGLILTVSEFIRQSVDAYLDNLGV
jgi:hypothetical protein